MKHTKRRLLLALTASLALAQPASGIGRGSQAPAFELPVADGIVKLDNYRGKVVYLDFWASWCGPCRQSFPWMNAMQSRFGAQGLQVVGINLDAKSEDGRRFLAKIPANFVVAFDPGGTSARLYGVKGMPSSVLIDRNGKVIFEHIGFNEADRADLEKAIQFALESNK